MPIAMNTNMDWKAAPNYNAANGTAGEADPETGIVKCDPGKTARTDNVEINFTGPLPEGQAEKIRSHIAALKNSKPLAKNSKQFSNAPSEIIDKINAQKKEKTAVMIKVGSFSKTAVVADGNTFSVKYA